MTIEIRLPEGMPADERVELLRAELSVGRQLLADGVLRSIWRVPGRRANVGIWQADDATALHRHLESLPMFPYMDISVSALASHPASAPPNE